MLSSANQAFRAISFFAFLFLMIAFCARLRFQPDRIGGLTVFAAWTGVSCLVLFVNNFLWDRENVNASPGWCDLSSRVLFASSSALLASSLCISFRIYCKATSPRPNDKLQYRLGLIEVAFPLAFPLIELILLCVVQDGRFTMYEDYGCRMQVKGRLSYLLIQGPMLLISLSTCYYALRSYYGFWETTGPVSGERAMLFQGATIFTVGIYLTLSIATQILEVIRIAPTAGGSVYQPADFTTVTVVPSTEASKTLRSLLNLEMATPTILCMLAAFLMISSQEVTRGITGISTTIANYLGRKAEGEISEKATTHKSSSSFSLPLPSITRLGRKKQMKPSEPPKPDYFRFLPPSQKPSNRESALIPARPDDMQLPDTGGLLRALSRSLSARTGASGDHRASRLTIEQTFRISVPPTAVHNVHLYHDQEMAMGAVSPALSSPSAYSIDSAERSNGPCSRVPIYDAFVPSKHC